MGAPRLLIADDQADVVEALRLLLKPEGYEIATAASPRAVLETVQAREFDLVLMDLNYARDTTSGAEGLDLLTRLRTRACSPSCAHRSSWDRRCGGVSGWRRRTGCSAAMAPRPRGRC